VLQHSGGCVDAGHQKAFSASIGCAARRLSAEAAVVPAARWWAAAVAGRTVALRRLRGHLPGLQRPAWAWAESGAFKRHQGHGFSAGAAWPPP